MGQDTSAVVTGTLPSTTTGLDGTSAAAGGTSGDGNTTDTATDSTGVAGTDPCLDVLFCDDFEDDAPGQAPLAPWVASTNGATVAVDTTRAFSGANSVHVFSDTAAAYRRGYFALQGQPVFPAASTAMYGRIMVWLESVPITPPNMPLVHWTMIQGEGLARQGDHNALYRYGGQQQAGAGFMANYETTDPTNTDCYQHSQTRIPVGTWTCLEWHFVQATNEMQLWLNGTEVTDVHIVDRGAGCLGNDLQGVWEAPPQFQSIYLGWERYQTPTNDGNLWIDDVAISTTRIGCPE